MLFFFLHILVYNIHIIYVVNYVHQWLEYKSISCVINDNITFLYTQRTHYIVHKYFHFSKVRALLNYPITTNNLTIFSIHMQMMNHNFQEYADIFPNGIYTKMRAMKIIIAINHLHRAAYIR